MSTQDGSICNTCGKPVERAGSITQWMFSAKCFCKEGDDILRELQLCPLCGLRPKGREGTMTGWIFRAKACSCLESDLKHALDFADLPEESWIEGSPYEWLAVAGRGGKGIVYKARSRKLNRLVAVKVIQDNSAADSFLREAKAVSKLQHPNIVAVEDYGVMQDGRQYLVIEWIDGITLSEYLTKFGPLSIASVHDIFSQILDAFAHAHKRDIVHRDIKPSNIILGRTVSGGWVVKVIDFGTAKELNHDGYVTKIEDMDCSPYYVSPERVNGLTVDHRTDLYSLGCTMFEALTGRPPFTGLALPVVMMHLSDPPPTLSSVSGGKQFPQYMEDIVARLLAKNPADRFADAGEVRKAFDERRVLPKVANVEPGGLEPDLRVQNKGFPIATWALAGLIFCSCSLIAVMAFIAFEQQDSKEPSSKVQGANSVDQAKIAQEDKLLDTPLWSRDFRVEADMISAQAPTKEDFETIKKRKGIRKIQFTGCKNFPRGFFSSLASGNTICEMAFSECTISEPDFGIQLAGLPKLNILVFSAIEGLTERAIAGLKEMQLYRLDFKFTNFSSREFKAVGQLRSIKFLSLNGTRLDDESMKLLTGLDKLVGLDLSNNYFSGTGLQYLGCKKTLSQLSIHKCPNLSPQGLANLKEFSHLTRIEYDDNKVTPGVLLSLKQCPSLDALMLPRCKIDDESLTALNGLTNLKYLSLSGARIGDREIEKLKGLKKLIYFNLEDTNVTAKGVRDFERQVKDLHVLYNEELKLH